VVGLRRCATSMGRILSPGETTCLTLRRPFSLPDYRNIGIKHASGCRIGCCTGIKRGPIEVDVACGNFRVVVVWCQPVWPVLFGYHFNYQNTADTALLITVTFSTPTGLYTT
jgi:hypothetical protein